MKVEETQKIDRFLQLLDKSGVCDLLKSKMVHDDINKGGRPSYNVYNMLVAILYSFPSLPVPFSIIMNFKSIIYILYIFSTFLFTFYRKCDIIFIYVNTR